MPFRSTHCSPPQPEPDPKRHPLGVEMHVTEQTHTKTYIKVFHIFPSRHARTQAQRFSTIPNPGVTLHSEIAAIGAIRAATMLARADLLSLA